MKLFSKPYYSLAIAAVLPLLFAAGHATAAFQLQVPIGPQPPSAQTSPALVYTQLLTIQMRNGFDGDTGLSGGGPTLSAHEPAGYDYAAIAPTDDTGAPKAVGETHILTGTSGFASFQAILPVADGEAISVSPDPATTLLNYAEGSTWTVTIGPRVYEISISAGEGAGGPVPSTGHVKRLQ